VAEVLLSIRQSKRGIYEGHYVLKEPRTVSGFFLLEGCIKVKVMSADTYVCSSPGEASGDILGANLNCSF